MRAAGDARRMPAAGGGEGSVPGPDGARVAEVLTAADRALEPRTDSPRLEADVLLAHVLGVNRTFLAARPETPLSPAAAARYQSLIARRVRGEPVAYLIGSREFWSLELEVNRDVLIPRPETERLVEAALERVPAGARTRVADLGTGCGAVAVAVGRERPRASILATDASLRALAVARRNLARAGVSNVRLVACDWLRALAASDFDLVLSNPPYVRDDDPHLGQGDVAEEPRFALAGGPDGLRAIRLIVSQCRTRLSAHGTLLLEHGFDQGAAVRGLLRDSGYLGVFSLEDYAGHERISGGRV